MKILKTTDQGKERLILFFAGWGMDWRPFQDLSRHGYDTAVVWDYRDESIDTDVLDGYAEICVVAWSFGVVAASRFIASHAHLPFTVRIAVNGTIYPSDERKGIPPAIFQGTYAALDERNLMKFYRRMCGDAESYARFRSRLPQRTVDELKEELAAVGRRRGEDIWWDVVYVSSRDAIIPPVNQLEAWRDYCRIKNIAASHMPDFDSILHDAIVDKELVSQRFARRVETYEANASVQAEMARELVRMWAERFPGSPGKVIEVGAGSGLFTREYLKFFIPDELELWDLGAVGSELPGRHVKCDAETAMSSLPEESVDTIVSACTVQWFNSLPRFLVECRRVLRPGGICLISTFAPLTFAELQPYVDRLLDTIPAGELRNIAGELFDYSEIIEHEHSLEFDTPGALLRHMQLTGVNAVDSSAGGRRAVKAILSAGIKTLTYRPVYMLLQKKA